MRIWIPSQHDKTKCLDYYYIYRYYITSVNEVIWSPRSLMSFLICHLCRSMQEHIFIFIIPGIMNIKTDLNSHGIKRKSMRIYCKFSLCAFLHLLVTVFRCDLTAVESSLKSKQAWLILPLRECWCVIPAVCCSGYKCLLQRAQSGIAGPQSSAKVYIYYCWMFTC